MEKTFEGFLKLKRKDIYHPVINRFDKVSHFSRRNKDLENDYHKLVRKYSIPYGNIIRKFPKEILDELDNDLKALINKHKDIIPED